MFGIRRGLFTSAFLVPLLLLISCARMSGVDENIVVLADGEALLKDATEYAKDQDLPIDEAVRRLELQDDVGRLDGQLTRGEPDAYGGLWLQHEPEFKVIVNTTGDSEKIADYTRGTLLAQGVEIEVRKVAKSLKRLEADQQLVIDTLENLKLPSESSVNVFTNQVELHVKDAVRLNSLLRAAGLLGVLEGVQVTTVDSFMSMQIGMYAGRKMYCTTGYSVRDSHGLHGISTASHCPDNNIYYEDPSGSPDMRLVGQWFGNSDVQWNRHISGTHSYLPWAADNEPTSQGTRYYREIYSNVNRPEQALNLYVCKYGVVTRFTCGYIKSKTQTAGGDYSGHATYIRVGKQGAVLSKAGDSGGPWYEGHAALGIHHGGFPDPSHPYYGQSVYTAINYVTDRGLIILHAPR